MTRDIREPAVVRHLGYTRFIDAAVINEALLWSMVDRKPSEPHKRGWVTRRARE